MELKVVCNCGQKYKFDVEPVNQRMPFAVNCPVCAMDGTELANSLLMQRAAPVTVGAVVAPGLVAAAPAPAGLKINRPPPPVTPPPIPVAAVAPPIPSAVPSTNYRPAPAIPKYMQTNPAIQNNSFVLGTVGALLGAVVAVGFMVGSHIILGFSFPIFGTVMGAIIGFGARLMYRGTDSTLGGMAALVAFITIGATLYLMFGILGILFSLVSLVIGVAMAFKIASG